MLALCDFWLDSILVFSRCNCPWNAGTLDVWMPWSVARTHCNRLKTVVSHLFSSCFSLCTKLLSGASVSNPYLLLSFQDEIALFVKNYGPFYDSISFVSFQSFERFNAPLKSDNTIWKKTVSFFCSWNFITFFLVFTSSELHSIRIIWTGCVSQLQMINDCVVNRQLSNSSHRCRLRWDSGFHMFEIKLLF